MPDATIVEINRFPKDERNRLYLLLVPSSIFERFEIDPKSLTNKYGEKVVTGIFPVDTNLGCIEVRYRSGDQDCIFSCQVSLETFMQSLHLDFLIINDPFSERFNVDTDEMGRDTLFGTRSRNVPEEMRAIEAGLAPGMVRKGLGLTREFMGCLENFMESIDMKTVSIRGLFYHNAISWERYGFTYFKGYKMMEKIHREFQPGGMLHRGLDDSTPFRRRGMETTVRGRSWAIYDGIFFEAFDEEWESPMMYKIRGKEFKVNTFPGQIY
ncbi:MAG: hypothetical protein ACE144_02845 [Thermodesulfobacteriota bacterium]